MSGGQHPRIFRMVLWSSLGHSDMSKNWALYRPTQPLLSVPAHSTNTSPSSTQLQGACPLVGDFPPTVTMCEPQRGSIDTACSVACVCVCVVYTCVHVCVCACMWYIFVCSGVCCMWCMCVYVCCMWCVVCMWLCVWCAICVWCGICFMWCACVYVWFYDVFVCSLGVCMVCM